MTNLRKAARGRQCMVRLPGVCNGDPSTTVLAHIRRGGVAGMGMKPPDLVGVWACSACHDVIDGRRKYRAPLMRSLDADILDALCRTLAQISKEGLV